jgi:PAS domain S-box-containing protein
LAARINCCGLQPKTLAVRDRTRERNGQGQRGNRGLAKLVLVLAVCCLLSQWMAAAQSMAAAQAKEVRRVLILHSLGFSSPASIRVDEEIRAALDNSPYQIELYEETLQGILFSDPASQREVRLGLIRKYRGRRPDIVIAVAPAPIKFMAESHDEFGPNTPVVFCASSEDQLDNLKLDSRFTGAWRTLDAAKTLEAALRLRPDTKQVVVVGGGVFWYDKRLEAIVKEQLHSYESRFAFTYLSNLEMPALLEKLRKLPKHSIVFYTAISQDAAGTHFIDETQSLPMVVGASNAPVFVTEDTFIGQGTVGGYVTSYSEEGRVAGSLAVRILNGEKPQNIPIVNDANIYMFDWRALQRWGLDEKRVPPGSIVLNRVPSVWDAYRKYILAAIFVVLAETLLVVALLWQRARRRQVEQSLVERLRFEELLSNLSTTFVNLPEEQVEHSVETSLRRIAEFLRVERVTLQEFSRGGTEFTKAFSTVTDGGALVPIVGKLNQFPWWRDRLLRGDVALVSDLKALPKEASSELDYFRKAGIVSVATVPLSAGGGILGFMLFASTKLHIAWTEELTKQLKMIGEIFSNSLKRKQSTEALLASNTELKRSEGVLRESEQRFRLVADTAPVLIWMSGSDKKCTFFNEGWLHFTGRSIASQLGDGWAEGVHAEDLRICMDTYTQAFDRHQEFRMEYRLRRHDGEYRWVLDIGVPRFDQERFFVGYIGTCVDLTDRKLAETALASVSRRMIEAQEQERTRIARELHDDIGQRLALFTVHLAQLHEEPTNLPGVRSHAGELKSQIIEIATDVQALSHRLHSSKLEYLGLATAMRGFCKEFGEQQEVDIDFETHDLPGNLSPDISLCFFRVLQEALHNSVKYSGVRHFDVRSWGTPNEVHLTVSDFGSGFDIESAKAGRGLGLISMDERLKILNGTLSIQSQLKRGTTVHAFVPLSPDGNFGA